LFLLSSTEAAEVVNFCTSSSFSFFPIKLLHFKNEKYFIEKRKVDDERHQRQIHRSFLKYPIKGRVCRWFKINSVVRW
jgi:hypothetical protein